MKTNADRLVTFRSFVDKCEQGATLFDHKNTQYNSAFRKYGLLGVVMEILGIAERIPPMTIWNEDKRDIRKLRDLFMDLHNYSNMALLLIDDNNWDGKHPIKLLPSGGVVPSPLDEKDDPDSST